MFKKKGRFLNFFMVHGGYRFISHYHNCDAQKDSLCGYHRSVVFSDFDSFATCTKSIFTVIYSIYWVKSHQIQVVSWSDLWWLTDGAILSDNRNGIKTVISSTCKGKFLLIQMASWFDLGWNNPFWKYGCRIDPNTSRGCREDAKKK